MENLKLYLIAITSFFTFACQHDKVEDIEKGTFKKISVIEYRLGMNDKKQDYDLIVLSLYEIDPYYTIKAYDFTKNDLPSIKIRPQLRKEINNLITQYPKDTKMPYNNGEEGCLCHGPYYLLVKEPFTGSDNLISFTPYENNKDLESLISILETEDYKSSLDDIKINKNALSAHYEKMVRRAGGWMGYPTLSTVEWVKEEKKDSAQQNL